MEFPHCQVFSYYSICKLIIDLVLSTGTTVLIYKLNRKGEQEQNSAGPKKVYIPVLTRNTKYKIKAAFKKK